MFFLFDHGDMKDVVLIAPPCSNNIFAFRDITIRYDTFRKFEGVNIFWHARRTNQCCDH